MLNAAATPSPVRSKSGWNYSVPARSLRSAAGEVADYRKTEQGERGRGAMVRRGADDVCLCRIRVDRL